MTERKLLFSPRAIRDLDEIWSYSARVWNDERADHYVRAIVKTCDRVATNPNLARNRNDLRMNYRSILSGSHIIFLRQSQNQMIVIRILHQRMEIDKLI